MSEFDQIEQSVVADTPGGDDGLPKSSPEGPRSSGISRVGKILRSRTTDLIAIALLAVIGLSIGREVSDWWQVDPAEIQDPLAAAKATLPVTAEWGTNGEPVDLRFGSARQQLSRRTFAGDAKQAEQELLADCKRFAELTESLGFEPDEQERRLLEKVPSATVVLADKEGRWTVYRTEMAGAKFVAVRNFSDQPDPKKTATPSTLQRIVAWGMMAPEAEGRWILYTFHAGTVRGGYTGELPNIVLPTESRVVMSMQSPLAGGMISFQTASNEAACRRHFDRWFEENSGGRKGDWLTNGGRSTGNFFIETPHSRAQISIVLYRDNEQHLNGVINIVTQQSPQVLNAPE